MPAAEFAWSPIHVTTRAIYGVLALMVVLPPEAFDGAIWINATGISAAVAMLAVDGLRQRALRRQGKAVGIAPTPSCEGARAPASREPKANGPADMAGP